MWRIASPAVGRSTVEWVRSDGKRQRSQEPMSTINVSGQFTVAAANILEKGVADADAICVKTFGSVRLSRESVWSIRCWLR